jgi:hypothetical protein
MGGGRVRPGPGALRLRSRQAREGARPHTFRRPFPNFLNDAQSDSWLCKRTKILSISIGKMKL